MISISLCECFIPIKKNASYPGNNVSACDPIKYGPLFTMSFGLKSCREQESEAKLLKPRKKDTMWKWWKGAVHPSGFPLCHKEPETVKLQFPTSSSPWEKTKQNKTFIRERIALLSSCGRHHEIRTSSLSYLLLTQINAGNLMLL